MLIRNLLSCLVVALVLNVHHVEGDVHIEADLLSTDLFGLPVLTLDDGMLLSYPDSPASLTEKDETLPDPMPTLLFGQGTPSGYYFSTPVFAQESGLTFVAVMRKSAEPSVSYLFDHGSPGAGYGLQFIGSEARFRTSPDHGGATVAGHVPDNEWLVISGAVQFNRSIELQCTLLNGTALFDVHAPVSLLALGPAQVEDSSDFEDVGGGPFSVGIQSHFPRDDRYLNGALSELHVYTSYVNPLQRASIANMMRDKWRGAGPTKVVDGGDVVEVGSQEGCEPEGGLADALPVVVQWLFIIILVMNSALFSGLTLGLMGLDPVTLKVLMEGGDEYEQTYAAKILPVRNRGNFLLCTLLLGNVAVNALLSILMAGLTGGLFGFLLSTAAIVVFGEITPQALCSRYGLLIGAKTIYIVYFFMILTFPLSYPISKILDVILGEDVGMIYQKQEMAKLLRIHAQADDSDITKGDVTILESVLNFDKKTVAQIMTPFDSVFSISMEDVLDLELLEKIMASGHSRIPVYEGDKKNVVSLLVVKHLCLLSPEDNISVRTVVEFHGKPVCQMWGDDTLDKALSTFKTIGNSHLATVRSVVYPDSGGDPLYELLGIVTLEDVIEELISCEIVDETDVYVDNTRKALTGGNARSVFALGRRKLGASMEPAMQDMLAKFLATTEPFNDAFVSFSVLRNFVVQGQVIQINAQDKNISIKEALYARGVRNNYFTVVLQGNVEIRAGAEGFVSTSGPFTVLGMLVLLKPDLSFVPDFTARCTTDTTVWRCTVEQYNTAVTATRLERGESNRRDREDTESRGRSESVVSVASRNGPPPMPERYGNDTEASDKKSEAGELVVEMVDLEEREQGAGSKDGGDDDENDAVSGNNNSADDDSAAGVGGKDPKRRRKRSKDKERRKRGGKGKERAGVAAPLPRLSRPSDADLQQMEELVPDSSSAFSDSGGNLDGGGNL